MIKSIFNIINTYLISMIPFIELRGGIPFGINKGLPLVLSFIVSMMGTATSAMLVFSLTKEMQIFFEKEHCSGEKSVFVYFLILLFICLPLGTCIGAFIVGIFNLDYRRSAITLASGIIITGIAIILLYSFVVLFNKAVDKLISMF